jgi:hypothetical protein
MDALDLDDIESPDVIEYPLLNKLGDKTATVFLLAGPGHPVRQGWRKKTVRRIRSEMNRRGKVKLEEDVDEVDAEDTEYLVAMTLGWRNLMKAGEDVPFSAQAARDLYSNLRAPIRAQISSALTDIANFTAGWSPSS